MSQAFPYLKELTSLGWGNEKKENASQGTKTFTTWCEHLKVPTFNLLNVAWEQKKKKRIRGYSLAYGRVASQKNEMSLKMFRIKTLKKTYFMY